MATRQSPYDLARLLDEYPGVFDAYWALAAGLSGHGQGKETFSQRREASRDERIARMARR